MIDILMPHPFPRGQAVLEEALRGVAHRYVQRPEPGRRVLFALCTDSFGMHPEALSLMRYLREHPSCMEGSVGSMLVDGQTELFTKELAQNMTLAASMAGCLFPGKPVVEATGSLYNQHIMAQKWGLSLEQTYFRRVKELIERLEQYIPPKFDRPKLLVIHASEQGRSATLWLWGELRKRLEPFLDLQVVSLQNGTIYDCRGCSYHACLHFAKNEGCFYGGAIAERVLPAIRESNALLFLCPNYNDAVSANITALFNRLTSFLLHSDLYEKYLYGIVVSGYSGSDLVARQLLGAMCLNKTAQLPPRFCLMETANDLQAIKSVGGMQEKLDTFAKGILSQLCKNFG